MTYVTLQETLPTTIEAFLRRLKDPLGCRICCMRTEILEKALEFVQGEFNIIYLQQRNEFFPDKKWQAQTQNNHFNIQPNINFDHLHKLSLLILTRRVLLSLSLHHQYPLRSGKIIIICIKRDHLVPNSCTVLHHLTTT